MLAKQINPDCKATLKTRLSFLGANDFSTRWISIDFGKNTLTVDLNSVRSKLDADQVVLVKVVSTFTIDVEADQDAVDIAQAETQFVIKFETEAVREEPAKE